MPVLDLGWIRVMLVRNQPLPSLFAQAHRQSGHGVEDFQQGMTIPDGIALGDAQVCHFERYRSAVPNPLMHDVRRGVRDDAIVVTVRRSGSGTLFIVPPRGGLQGYRRESRTFDT